MNDDDRLSPEDADRFRAVFQEFKNSAERVRLLQDEMKAARIDLAVIEERGTNPTLHNGSVDYPFDKWNIETVMRTAAAMRRVASIHSRTGEEMTSWADALERAGALTMEISDKLNEPAD